MDTNTPKVEQNMPVVEQNGIPPELRASKNTVLPASPPNGGLYGGPQSDEYWMPQPVAATDTNFTHNLLKSACPPPGATEQYISNIRPGNNYVAKVGVYKYRDTHPVNKGPFRDIQGTMSQTE